MGAVLMHLKAGSAASVRQRTEPVPDALYIPIINTKNDIRISRRQAPPNAAHRSASESELQPDNRHLPIALLTLEIVMNWDVIEGNWAQYKGHVKAQWGKLTNDHLDVIAGKRDQLAGKIQESYGIGRDEADKQIKAFQKYLKDSRPS